MIHPQGNLVTVADSAKIVRDLRWLKIYAAVTTISLAILGLTAAKAPESKELTVERINIVDPSGVPRLVISNAERIPLPKLNGKEYPRAVHPAGIIFYDTKGNEVGGLAITDASIGKVSALAFDYPNYDAMGMVTRVSPDGKNSLAGLQINSRPPADLDVIEASKVVQRRIAIHNDNEDAEILLADPQGRDRIRLRVTRDGQARIEVLDEQGEVTFSAPSGA
ncbi:hypothetical protein [Thermomonas fusca]